MNIVVYAAVKDMVIHGSEQVSPDELHEIYASFVRSHKFKDAEDLLIFAALLDDKTANKLVRQYWPLVQKMAHAAARRANRPDLLDDLMGVAQLALVESLRDPKHGYDPEKFYKVGKGKQDPLAHFGTYAKNWIFMKLRTFIQKEFVRTEPSLEKPLKEGELDRTLMDIIKKPGITMEEDIEMSDMRKMLKELMRQLNKYEKKLLIDRYGLGKKPPKRVEDIAKEIPHPSDPSKPITRQTANNWLREAEKKLRRILEKMGMGKEVLLSGSSLNIFKKMLV